MYERVKLSRVATRLDDLSYPVSRVDAVAAFTDVNVLMADGEENLGTLVAEVPNDSFDSSTELWEDLQSVLPIEAVGEPGQSDGDA
jgi:hypothetical protein